MWLERCTSSLSPLAICGSPRNPAQQCQVKSVFVFERAKHKATAAIFTEVPILSILRKFKLAKRERRLFASIDKEKLQSRVLESTKVLESINLTLQRRIADSQLSSVRVEDIIQQLWDRQDSILHGELKRWEQERVTWDRKEAALLKHINELQEKILHLAAEMAYLLPKEGRQIGQSSMGAGASKSVSQDVLATLNTQGPQQPSPTTASEQATRPASVIDEASQYLPREELGVTTPNPDEFALSANPVNSDQERLRRTFKAAFEAVDNQDVLTTALDAFQLEEADVTHSNFSHQNPGTSMQGEMHKTPPVLSLGADDIFWTSQLHAALMKVFSWTSWEQRNMLTELSGNQPGQQPRKYHSLQASYYPGEEDMEDWYFGEQTLSAVLTFQASKELPETGIVDESTWRQLLGQQYATIKIPEESKGTPSAQAASQTSLGASLAAPNDHSVSPASSAPNKEGSSIVQLRMASEMENRRRNEYQERKLDPSPVAELQLWPVLREGDGGRNVHYLQVALERKGFTADEEDQRWWFFGTSTHDCVLTFQACAGLPENGIVDPVTWITLLDQGATPASLAHLHNDYEDDMTNDSEAIWLLGEQRWARRKK